MDKNCSVKACHAFVISRAYNLFREIFKFRVLKGAIRNFEKHNFIHIFANFKCLNKKSMKSYSPDYKLLNDTEFA